jgi:HlyD family secretion protein
LKPKYKILIGVIIAVAVGVGIFASIRYNRRGIVTVQTSKVSRADLTSLVTASGEIKPKNYINIGANVMGRIVDLTVKEGDHVNKNEIVARLEAIQAQADVEAQRAALRSAQSDSAAAESGLTAMDENTKTAVATRDRAKADLDRAKADFDRAKLLFDQKLIARQDFDQRSAAYESARASLRETEARIGQMQAQRSQTNSQLASAQRRVSQVQAVLNRVSDVLQKHNAVSPIDGIVTNLPVRVGETVVPGIQNSSASLIMTIADMSEITAEVKVDETDIVNVHVGQVADISIDAIPNRTFKGHVTEIGNTAILRSTGLAASQSAVSSQEAKDFKVVVALDNPPPEIRPGLSCTAKVTTATRANALSIPIQALTVRTRGDLRKKDTAGVQAATKNTPAEEKRLKEELQGVFVVINGQAQFREVKTGITGATDIEVLSGLNEGQDIITGSYKVIRTLRANTRVEVDNKVTKQVEST